MPLEEIKQIQNKVEDAAIYLLKELAKQGYNIDNKNL